MQWKERWTKRHETQVESLGVSGTDVLCDSQYMLSLLKLQVPQPEQGVGGVCEMLSAEAVSEHMPLYFLKNSTTNIKNFNSPRPEDYIFSKHPR